MLSDSESIELHLAQDKPSRWSALIMDLAEVDPEKALITASMVHEKEIEEGFSGSQLRLIAAVTIRQIERQIGHRGHSLADTGSKRCSADFYRTPHSWGVTGGQPFTPV